MPSLSENLKKARKPAKLLIDYCLRSLRDHPEQWEFDEYEAINKAAKIRIWVANKHYGLEIKIPGFSVGGVTPFGCFLTPWRRKIRQAVDQAAFDRAISKAEGVK